MRRNAILLFYCFLLGVMAAPAEVTVLDNFTLIDGNGGAGAASSSMVIVEGRIQWVGPKSQLKAPAGAQTVQLDGKYVMPGIINLHSHLGNTLDLTSDPKNFTRANVEAQLRMYASYGVTSVISMGSDQDLIYQLRGEQRIAGRPRLTRIFTAGRGFTGRAGYPTSAPGMKGVPFEVSTPAEVERAVAQLADKRVDIVKIWVDDHLGKENKISIDLCRAIIQSAQRRGLKVVAHVYYLEDAKALIDAGLYGLVHAVRDKPVDQALINLLKKRNAWQAASTLTREMSTFAFAKPHPILNDPLFARSVSANVLKTLKDPAFQAKAAKESDTGHGPQYFEMASKNLKTLVDAGVKVAFGTDSGPPRRFQGYFEHWEMELMAGAGLTPNQIITIATKNSAEFLGAKDLGTLQAGKWADLVVLTKNPLDDIKNARSIETVMIAGQKVN